MKRKIETKDEEDDTLENGKRSRVKLSPSTTAVLPQVFYIYSTEYVKYGSLLPSNTIHKFEQCVDDEEHQENSRSFMVHSLIQSYGLHRLSNVTVVAPEEATLDDLKHFHSKDYIEALCRLSKHVTTNLKNGTEKQSTRNILGDGKNDENDDSCEKDNEKEDDSDEYEDDDEQMEQLKREYGFVDDAEPFPHMLQYCKTVAGGSLSA